MVDNIENGTVSVNQPDSATTNITASNTAVINFKSFNIAAGETVNFIQPSANSTVLSRVTGPDPSKIFGTLAANGILFIVNPNGIHFGPGAVVTANSLVASTLDIATNNFKNGIYTFEKGNRSPAEILNEAGISGDGKSGIYVENNAALMAGSVDNRGVVIAKAGTVHLVSGDKTTVSFDRRGLISVEVDSETATKPIGIDGVTIEDAAVANSGIVQGQSVVMTAKTAQGIFENAVNQTGTVKADTIVEHNGAIFISANHKVQASGEFEGNTTVASKEDVNVYADLTVKLGNLQLLADYDLDGNGAFHQAPGTTIYTIGSGDITIQSSGASTLANINSAGNLELKQGGAPAVFTQLPNSIINTNGSIIINNGVTLNAANTQYNINKDWINLGVFNPNFSTINLKSQLPANITGNNKFYNFTVNEPGKIVRFDTTSPLIIINNLVLKGAYGNLLTLTSIDPGKQWSINPQGQTDIQFALISNLNNIRGPPLKALHTSSAGNNINLDLDPIWTANGSTNNWSDPDNWDTGTLPTQFDTVTFNLPNSTISIDGNITVTNFICTAPGTTFIFKAGSLATILGNFTIHGAPDNYVVLKSSIPGSQWSINVANKANVSLTYIFVSDANNTANYLMPMYNSFKGANCWNWDADLYWVGGTSTSWSDTNNWATASGGSTHPAAVPGATDTAIFDAGGLVNCALDDNVNVSGFTILSGYTKTITQNSGKSITVGAGGFSQADGTFTGGDTGITITGALTISGGAFTSPSGSTTTVAVTGLATFSGGTYTTTNRSVANFNGGMTISGTGRYNNYAGSGTGTTTTNVNDTFLMSAGTLGIQHSFILNGVSNTFSGGTASSGTVVMSGTSQTLSSSITLATFTHTTGTLDINSDFAITGHFTNSGGTINFNGHTITIGGSIFPDSGTINVGASTVNLTGGINLRSTGTIDCGTGTINNNGTVIIGGGTLTAPSSAGAFYVGANWTKTGGTFTAGTGTVTFNGTGAQTLGTTSATTFTNLTVNKSSGTLTLGINTSVTGNLNIQAGTLDLSSYTLDRSTAGGTLTLGANTTLKIGGTGTLPSNYSTHSISSSSTIEYNGSTQSVAVLNSSQNYGNLTISAAGTKTVAGTITVAGALTVSAGTFTAGGNTVTVTGLATISGGEYQASTATQAFNGGLTISGGTFTGSTGEVDVATLTLSSGTLTAPSGTFKVSGDWAVSGTPTFTAGSGTVTFNGTTQAISSTTVFNNITVNSGATVTNNGTVTAASLGSGTGAWTQGANSTLTYSGTSITPTFTASATGNTVNYVADANTSVYLTTYYNLQIGNATTQTLGRTYTLTGNTTVTNVITIGPSSGSVNQSFNDGGYTLTLSGTGTPMVVNSNGRYTSTSGTVNYTGDGATNINQTPAYFNLQIGNATTQTAGQTYSLVGLTVIHGILTIGPTTGSYTQTLVDVNHGLTFTASGTPLVINSKGAYSPSANTISYTGDGPTNIIAFNYWNLQAGNATTQTAGQTYTLAGNTTVRGVLTIGPSSGSYTQTFADGGYTLTLSGTGTPMVINSKGAYSATGTVDYTAGSGTQTLISAGSSFYNLTHSGGGTLQLSTNDLIISGNFNNSDGTFDTNAKNVSVGGDWSNSATLSSTGSTSTITFTKSSGTQTITPNGSRPMPYNLVHSGAGILSLAGNSLYLLGAFTNSSGAGNFTANTYTVQITGAVTLSGGTFTASSQSIGFGSLVMDGGSFTGSTGAVSFGSSVALSAGTLNANGANVSAGGLVTVSGTGIYQSSTGTNNLYGGLTISGGTFTGGSGAVNVDGAFTMTSGSFTAPSGTFTVSGNWSVSGGTFVSGSNTVTFDGASAGNAAQFSGTTSDAIKSGFTGINVSQGSISIWVYTTDVDSAVTNIRTAVNYATANTGGSDGLIVLRYYYGSFQVQNGAGGSSLSVVAGADLNTWTHYVVTWDAIANQIILYRNGSNVTSGTYSGTTTSNAVVAVGCNSPDSRTLQGKIDETVFWSGVALTSSQVTTLYNSGSGYYAATSDTAISGASIVALYHMDESGTPGTLTDATGTNNLTATSVTMVTGEVPSSSTVTQTLDSGAQSFNNIAHSGSYGGVSLGTLQLSTNNLTMTGTFTHSAGTFDVNSKDIAISGSWTNNGGTFSPSNGTITFNNTTAAQYINGTATSQTFNNITISKSNQTFSMSGSTATLVLNGTLLWSSGNTQDISSGKTITINSASTTFNTQDNSITISGTLDGTGTLTKSGVGTLILSGTNTYSGGTSLAAGTLDIRSTSALGTGTLTLAADTTITNNSGSKITVANGMIWNSGFIWDGSNRELQFDGNVTMNAHCTITTNGSSYLDITGVISGAYNLIKKGTGYLYLSGANTYTGTSSILAGTIQTGKSAPSGSAGAFGNAISDIILGNSTEVSDAILRVYYNYPVGRGITVQTFGEGTATITYGATSFSGAITLNSSLALTCVNASGSTTTFSSNFSGSGGLILSSQATTPANGIAILSGTNTYSGGIALNSGTLDINSATALGAGAFTIASGTVINNSTAATITLSNNNTQTWNGSFTFTGTQSLNMGTGAVTLGATPTVTVSASTLTVGGTITGSYDLTKDGAGTLALGANAVSINALSVSAGAFTASSGKITLNGNFTLSGGTFTSTSGTMFVSGAFSHTAGTWDANNGTVVLNNTSNQNLDLTAATTFYRLYINDGLVGYWKFDEAVGTSAADSSGYGNTGTNSGATITSATTPVHFTDSKLLSFDGTDDYVLSNSNIGISGNSARTVSLWIYPTTASGRQTLVCWGSANNTQLWWIEYNGYQGSPQNIYVGGWDDDAYTAAQLPLNQWSNVVVVYPGTVNTDTKIYYNGVSQTVVGYGSSQGALNTANAQVSIGYDTVNSRQPFNGSIDDVRIYNRALNSTEISALAAGNQPATSSATTTITGGSLTVSGNLVLNAGTLDTNAAQNNAIAVAANWENNGGKFTPNSGTVTMNGTSGSNIILSGSQSFKNLAITGNGGTWALNDNLAASGTFTQSNGTFNGNGYTNTVTGLATISGGTYTTGAGTQTFNGGLTIQNSPTFTGSATVGTALTVDTGATFAPTSGTITMSNSSSITNNGTGLTFAGLTIASGATVSTSSSFSIGKALTLDNGSSNFSPAGGTITMNTGWSIVNVSAGTLAFSGLKISGAVGAQPSSSFSVNGTLTVDNGVTLAPSAGTITMNGGSDIVNNGTLTFFGLAIAYVDVTHTTVTTSTDFRVGAGGMSVGANAIFTASGGTARMLASYTIINSGASLTFNNLTIAGAPTVQTSASFSIGGALTINDGITLAPAAGTITMNNNSSISVLGAGSLTFYGLAIANNAAVSTSSSFKIGVGGMSVGTGANFSPTGGTVTMNSFSWTLTNSGTLAFSGLTIAKTATTQTSSSFSVSGALTVNDGVAFVPTGSSMITMTTGSSINTAGTGSITFKNLTVSGNCTANSGFTVAGTMDVTGGTFNANGNTVTATGLTTVSGGTYSASTAIQTFNGGLTVSGGTFTGSSGTVDVNGSLTLSGGTLTAPSGNFTVSGSWTKTGGTFTPGTNTVTFDDSSQTSTISGSTAFYNLTSNTAGKTITLTRGTEQTVTNALNLTGSAANPIVLNATGAGAVPKLTVNSGASQSITNVSVTNNDASGGIQLVARGTGSSLSGTTTNWVLGSSGTTFTWTGTASSDWNNPLNWDLGLVPSSTDKVIIPSGTPHAPAFSGDVNLDRLTINSGETLTTGGYTLTITGDLIINGSLDADSSTITVGGNITGAGWTLIGVNPVINAAGYIGTFTSPLGINISGTLTMHAGGINDNTSISLNGNAGNFAWRENMPGFIIVNGNVYNWFGQNSIRPVVNSGSSALYSGGNFVPMMMPSAPVFLPPMPAGPAPAIPVAAPAPVMAPPIPVATPMVVSVPTPMPKPEIAAPPLPTESTLPVVRLPVVPRVELPAPLPKATFENINAQIKFPVAHLPVIERVELPSPLPKPSFEEITSQAALPQPQAIGIVSKAVNLMPRPDFTDVISSINMPLRAFFFGAEGRIDLVPRPDLIGFIPYVHLSQGANFSDLVSGLNMPEPVFSERFGKISAAVTIPPGADFSGVAQKLVLPKPVSFERAGGKIVAPERITPMSFEGINAQARVKVLFPGGGQVIPNFGLGIPLGAEKPLLEPKIKKEEKK